MTRGQMVIVLPNNKVLTSIEFNGDMYFEGLGQEAFLRLIGVTSEDEYRHTVEEFNARYYKYKENLIYSQPYDSLINMKNYDYFNLTSPNSWFSDYLYVKNLSGDSIVVNTHKNTVCLANEGVCVLNFEIYEPHCGDKCEVHELKTKLVTREVSWSIDINWPEDTTMEAQEQVINQIIDRLQNGSLSGSVSVKYFGLDEK